MTNLIQWAFTDIMINIIIIYNLILFNLLLFDDDKRDGFRSVSKPATATAVETINWQIINLFSYLNKSLTSAHGTASIPKIVKYILIYIYIYTN